MPATPCTSFASPLVAGRSIDVLDTFQNQSGEHLDQLGLGPSGRGSVTGSVAVFYRSDRCRVVGRLLGCHGQHLVWK
ncbi:MAG: hypothetical protein ACKOEM_15755 [Planctomycetia bacterium]